jgi:hypothetical protein
MRWPFKSLECDDRADFGRAGNVVLVRARDQERPETFALLERHVRAVAADCGTKAAILLIVEHTKGPPPGFVEDAKGLLDRCAPVLAGTASALLAQGFVAAVYRSMGAMLLTLLGRRDVVGIHGSVEDSATWLVARLPSSPHSPDAASLVAAAHALTRS